MSRLAIDTDYLVTILSKLLKTPSPSGYTDNVVRLVTAELADMGIDAELTRRGAIRAVRRGADPRGARAIVSHLDTLGAQVKNLKDNGRLEIVPIGHWSSRFAEGARCTIFTEKGTYRGSILPLKASGHTFNKEIDSQPVSWDNVEVRVDAYARGKVGLAKLGIDIGDIISIDPQTEILDNGYIVSRHLDDKAGVAIMLAAIRALQTEEAETPVDVHFLFTIAEEVGVGASSILQPQVASMVAIDNGTTAPGQNSDEFGVTIAMADQTGPFDYHLTKKLAHICRDEDIRYQKDVFRYYRSDSASAVEAGADVRTALITFGIDASHGYERIHLHALRSVAELVTAYATSPVMIERDLDQISDVRGFTKLPSRKAKQNLSADIKVSDAKTDPN
ncbi:osmoprotectant NAGGN system M42 family peptidase [Novosphingobium album (ex Hu et al. 2023)]|uniref:Osmoprotectant NAGGN system M42 family peptidase n=1 Tax=Novosphingobium album (ex Hu et al. 2023) TaxID=2930093 RepID=A0ABT0B3D6_9SPHN|nr:osmoprotectant NAGGN system M42 family peptidase [Novosphingobium album (ex Hu et al. 2023)]MCJ2179562.1 osmoprotectant NAGGN system M42 family peptidase [Novosphingobium album (ex Hu et al. 2023)]